jgi:LmbE family N-acetylglucosaminyl deacetylase
MNFHHPNASLFVPDDTGAKDAYHRTTHLGIGAHADDLEIMAFHGIHLCYHSDSNWFGGVTCTNGSGSARMGPFANKSDEEMVKLRHEEQKNAALLGKYSFVAQLDYPSSEVKNPDHIALDQDLTAILAVSRPEVVYTHNPADKHETHIGVIVSVIDAIRCLPKAERPATVYGCEVWRDLDWMMDSDKVALDVSDSDGLDIALVDVFSSQIEGGKRYSEATFGRRWANATYYRSHEVDEASQLVFAMDLSPLAKDDSIDLLEFVNHHIHRFQQDVEKKLKKQMRKR